MTTFERWREEDSRWVDENLPMVEIVFRWFLKKGKWPEIDELRRWLFWSGQNLDPQSVADAKPTMPSQLAVGFRTSITLGARHLLHLPSAQPLLDLLVRATAQAIQAYRGPGDHPSVRTQG
jgi:hypothetical protein